jgi:hypothetical protein
MENLTGLSIIVFSLSSLVKMPMCRAGLGACAIVSWFLFLTAHRLAQRIYGISRPRILDRTIQAYQQSRLGHSSPLEQDYSLGRSYPIWAQRASVRSQVFG